MPRHPLFVLTLVVLVALSRSGRPMAAAGQQRHRTQTPAPPELFEVHERSILELQAAQVEGRVTSRGLVDALPLSRVRQISNSVRTELNLGMTSVPLIGSIRLLD